MAAVWKKVGQLGTFRIFRTRNYPVLPSILPTRGCNGYAGMHYSTQVSAPKYDVVIVGGGIVGTATARELSVRHPKLNLAIIEKEHAVGLHQSGHNSGVIHAGIYYTPGSLKAKLCVEGLKETYKYCDANNIPYKKVGKLIVAVNNEESERLTGLFERGLQNEVPGLQLVGPDKIREIEPNCRGLKAIYSPETGIVDYLEVTKSYASNFEQQNGSIFCNFKAKKFSESDDPEFPITIEANSGHIQAKYVIGCAGLYSDKMAQVSGYKSEPKIVPFRGEYLLLKPDRCDLVKGNIYPVPNPKLPFLGVHFTPRMDGSVWLGPSAMLAFKREGYRFMDFSFPELMESVSYRGTLRLVLKHIKPGLGELYRKAYRRAQVKILQQYVPDLKYSDVTSGPSGVRAQALDRDGKLVDDFIFDTGYGPFGSRILHVRNAPSPAATSSIPIARMVADKAKESFGL